MNLIHNGPYIGLISELLSDSVLKMVHLISYTFFILFQTWRATVKEDW